MLKVAIVGCGKIADAHASQIRRIRGCEIVAACDREPLMAEQFCERFAIRNRKHFSDVDDMLADARPDVVHVTTPPGSHFDVARRCLERGSHVYVEKPFALCAEDVEALLRFAAHRALKITAGHDDQFSHAARRMRRLVRSGYLGGAPVHMESHYCYDLGEPSYARAILGDRNHWVRALPGKLLHNIISHGIARIAEFLTTDTPRVIAYGFTSPILDTLNEREIIDELRVIIADDVSTTAYFTFSSQMRPAIHQFRIYGRRNGLALDSDQETVIKLRGRRFTSYGERFLPPVIFAQQYLGNLMTNAKAFLAADFHMKSGMKHLIESFYHSITNGTAPPIPYREILLTARIMDAIFEQLACPERQAHVTVPRLSQGPRSHLA
jgi:predicted dehydrogenase